MDVSNVTESDGRKCIQLINLLKVGRWELSGPDIVAHTETIKWVQELALKLGTALSPQAGLRIKSVGSLPVKKQKLDGSDMSNRKNKTSRKSKEKKK